MSDVALLQQVDELLGELSARTFDARIDDDTLRASVLRLQRCESVVHAEKLRRLAEVDERKAYLADNHRSTADWLADLTGLSGNEARRQAQIADALTRLPQTAARLAKGSITAGHAAAAADGLADLDRRWEQRRRDAEGDVDDYLAADEAGRAVADAFDWMVAGSPAGVDRAELSRRITSWTLEHDPETVAEREAKAVRKRGWQWSRQRDADGLWRATVRATDADRAQLDAGIEPLARKQAADDQRVPAQRRLDAAVELSRRACDSGGLPDLALQRPHMICVRTENPGGSGETQLAGVGPVSDATADLVACDADHTVVRKDSAGRIWDVHHAGPPNRKQRVAVIARDTRCVGCGAPAYRCQIHHIRWRRHNGKTVIDNLVLVCWSCHQGIHHLGWTITGDPIRGFTVDRHPARDALCAAGAGPPRLTG